MRDDDGWLERLLKERAKIKHACINRECQSPRTKRKRLLSRSPLISRQVHATARVRLRDVFLPVDFHVEAALTVGVCVWRLSSLISMRRRRWSTTEKFRLTVAPGDEMYRRSELILENATRPFAFNAKRDADRNCTCSDIALARLQILDVEVIIITIVIITNYSSVEGSSFGRTRERKHATRIRSSGSEVESRCKNSTPRASLGDTIAVRRARHLADALSPCDPPAVKLRGVSGTPACTL